jgi:hypothetical protein
MTPSDRFDTILQYFAGAVALGMLFSALRYPFFIDSGIQHGRPLSNPLSPEGNLLVFTSHLIGEVHGTENDQTVVLFSKPRKLYSNETD